MFGPDYIIPKPFDPRLILHIAPAVAKAAMEAGVARKPVNDFEVYKHELERFVFRSGQLLRPVIEVARKSRPRIVYAEGEDERTLRAVQGVVDDGMAQPILVGRGIAISAKISALGLRMQPGHDVRIVDFEQDKASVYANPEQLPEAGRPPWRAARFGGAPFAQTPDRGGGMLLAMGEADAAICGGTGDWWRQFQYALPIIPRRAGVSRVYALTALILQAGRAVLLRHACECRANRGRAGGNDDSGGANGASLWHDAESGVALALQFRGVRIPHPRARCALPWR